MNLTTRFYLVFIILSSVVSLLFAEPPWKFIIAGDTRSDGKNKNNGVNVPILGEIAAEVVRQKADFILIPGDLVYGGVNQKKLQKQLTTWRDAMQPVYDANIAVYPVRGNHDVGKPAGVKAWDTVFSCDYSLPTNGPAGETGLTYSVTHKNSFILVLDQYVSRNRVNQPWIDAQLAANTNTHIFAMGHTPAFKARHSDCLDDHPADRDVFWASLKSAGCRVYACGHDHFYDHAAIDDGDGNSYNDIHQYIVGTAGAPLRNWSGSYSGKNSEMMPVQRGHSKKHGYILAEVTDLNFTMTWFERSDKGKYAAVASQSELFILNKKRPMKVSER